MAINRSPCGRAGGATRSGTSRLHAALHRTSRRSSLVTPRPVYDDTSILPVATATAPRSSRYLFQYASEPASPSSEKRDRQLDVKLRAVAPTSGVHRGCHASRTPVAGEHLAIPEEPFDAPLRPTANKPLQQFTLGPERDSDSAGARNALTPRLLAVHELLASRLSRTWAGRVRKIEGNTERQLPTLGPLPDHGLERPLHQAQRTVDVERVLGLPPPLRPVAQGHVPLEPGVRVPRLHQIGAVGSRIPELVAQLLERSMLRPVPVA